MTWTWMRRLLDVAGRIPRVPLLLLGCGLTRGWLDILILEARSLPSIASWLPAGSHVVMALSEAIGFFLLGFLALRKGSLFSANLTTWGAVGIPFIGGILLIISDSQPTSTIGLVLCGLGYASQLLLWLEVFGCRDTRSAALAWSWSSVVSFLLWVVVDTSTVLVNDVLLLVLPLISTMLALAARLRTLQGHVPSHETGITGCGSSAAVPWLLLLWISMFALSYGVSDGVTGMAFSSVPSRVGMVVPAILVIGGIAAIRGSFDFRALALMAVGGMVIGLCTVFIFRGSWSISQLFISAANESYLMFAHMFSCSLAYRLRRSAAGLSGLVGGFNIVAIQVGMVMGKSAAPLVEGDYLPSLLIGAFGATVCLAVTVAAVYNRDYLDSFTLSTATDKGPHLGGYALRLQLSPKEEVVFSLLAKGMSTSDMARELFLAPSTIRAHTSNIYKKMGVHSRAEFETALQKEGVLK